MRQPGVRNGSAVAPALALLLASCGLVGFDPGRGGSGTGDGGGSTPVDAGPDGAVGDAQGLWLGLEVTPTGTGPRARDDLVGGVRFELQVSGTALTWRAMLLDAGLPAGLTLSGGTVTVAPAQWVLTTSLPMSVATYAATWTSGDEVTLTYQPGRPGDVGAPPYSRLRLARAPAHDEALIGEYQLAAFRIVGEAEAAAGSCAIAASGSRQLAGKMTIDASYQTTLAFDHQIYSQAGCGGSVADESDVVSVFLEVEGGRYRAWGSSIQVGDFSSGGTMTQPRPGAWRMGRDTCAPAAVCDDLVDVLEWDPQTALR
jgi:hypothetical protein